MGKRSALSQSVPCGARVCTARLPSVVGALEIAGPRPPAASLAISTRRFAPDRARPRRRRNPKGYDPFSFCARENLRKKARFSSLVVQGTSTPCWTGRSEAFDRIEAGRAALPPSRVKSRRGSEPVLGMEPGKGFEPSTPALRSRRMADLRGAAREVASVPGVVYIHL